MYQGFRLQSDSIRRWRNLSKWSQLAQATGSMPCKDCFCLLSSFLDTVKWATHSTTHSHSNIYHRPQAARDQPAWTESAKAVMKQAFLSLGWWAQVCVFCLHDMWVAGAQLSPDTFRGSFSKEQENYKPYYLSLDMIRGNSWLLVSRFMPGPEMAQNPVKSS